MLPLILSKKKYKHPFVFYPHSINVFTELFHLVKCFLCYLSTRKNKSWKRPRDWVMQRSVFCFIGAM